MPTNSNTENRKYFAYVTAPQHVTTELIKLNGTLFNSKKKQKINQQPFLKQTYLDQHHEFFSNHLADENYQIKLTIGSAKKKL